MQFGPISTSDCVGISPEVAAQSGGYCRANTSLDGQFWANGLLDRAFEERPCGRQAAHAAFRADRGKLQVGCKHREYAVDGSQQQKEDVRVDQNEQRAE